MSHCISYLLVNKYVCVCVCVNVDSHSFTAALDQLRVVASSSNDPGGESLLSHNGASVAHASA